MPDWTIGPEGRPTQRQWVMGPEGRLVRPAPWRTTRIGGSTYQYPDTYDPEGRLRPPPTSTNELRNRFEQTIRDDPYFGSYTGGDVILPGQPTIGPELRRSDEEEIDETVMHMPLPGPELQPNLPPPAVQIVPPYLQDPAEDITGVWGAPTQMPFMNPMSVGNIPQVFGPGPGNIPQVSGPGPGNIPQMFAPQYQSEYPNYTPSGVMDWGNYMGGFK